MTIGNFKRLALVLIATLVMSGCATRFVTSEGGDSNLMLAGNDPVSYQTAAAPVKGDPSIKTAYDSGTYRFTSTASRDEFMKNPAKYAPQYGGFCSNGAPYSIMMGGSATTYKVVNGRLFVFSGPDSRKYWEMEEAKNIQLGDHYWETEMKDTMSASMHSYYRIANKVPHYKTGKQLDEMWQTRQATKK